MSISDLKDLECPRHNVLSILTRLKCIEREPSFNRNLFAGNLLHLVFQDTILKAFSYVRFFHCREHFGVEEALYKTMKLVQHKWQDVFLTLYMSKDYPEEEIDAGIAICESQIPNMARMSTVLVRQSESLGLVTNAIADEFTVQRRTEGNLLLTGHVDLVALDRGCLKLIELKTGAKYESDVTQLRAYGEIVADSYTVNRIQLELWYSRTGKVIRVNLAEPSVLERIEEAHRIALGVKNESMLPPRIDEYRCGRMCMLCGDIPELFSKSDSLPFTASTHPDRECE